jgi:hypothetical protein
MYSDIPLHVLEAVETGYIDSLVHDPDCGCSAYTDSWYDDYQCNMIQGKVIYSDIYYYHDTEVRYQTLYERLMSRIINNTVLYEFEQCREAEKRIKHWLKESDDATNARRRRDGWTAELPIPS